MQNNALLEHRDHFPLVLGNTTVRQFPLTIILRLLLDPVLPIAAVNHVLRTTRAH
jgi:hypothetical protein